MSEKEEFVETVMKLPGEDRRLVIRAAELLAQHTPEDQRNIARVLELLAKQTPAQRKRRMSILQEYADALELKDEAARELRISELNEKYGIAS